MGSEVKIYDYVDSSGQNRIAAWLKGIGVKPKAKLNNILYNLSGVPRTEWHKHKAAEKRKGEPDLWEIKAFANKVQWRLLGFFGPEANAFTLAGGAIEKQYKLEPPSEVDRALQRIAEVKQDPAKHRRPHDYS